LGCSERTGALSTGWSSDSTDDSISVVKRVSFSAQIAPAARPMFSIIQVG
jgi:hypothetical protein